MDIDRYIKIKTNNLLPVKGRVLLSEPLMSDYYFGRSVVLLAEHNPEGSVGVIINKILPAKITDFLKDFRAPELPVYLGGPVENNRLFYIHTLGDIIQDSVWLKEGLYWGGSLNDVNELAKLKVLKDNNFRFFLGYSGWGADQLSAELKRNSWAVTNINVDQIFNMKPNLMWKNLTQQLGSDYKLWSKFPENPMYN